MRLEMFVAIVAMSAAASCTQPAESIVCTDLFAYGLTVSVTDSSTQSAMSSGVSVVARDGSYVDSAAPFPGASTFALAGERAGTYSVTVRKVGYKDWVKSGIQVTKDVCHVQPVGVTARLQPLP